MSMIDAGKTGQFIAECRREKGLTQQELGDRLHVTNRAVSKWENGKSFPDVGLLEDLGRELEVSVGELLAGRRMDGEQYREETEKVMVEALGIRRLYGYEIVTYIMSVLAVLAFWIPMLTTGNGEFMKPMWPPVTVVNVLCWMICVGLIGCVLYLDRELPGKSLRGTNWKLSGIMGSVVILLSFLYPFLRDVVQEGGRPLTFWDWILVAAVLLIMVPLGALVWSCRADSRRQKYREKEYERQQQKKEEKSTNEDIDFERKSEGEEQHHAADSAVSGKTSSGTHL